jgi:hypothetical protein
MVIAERLPQWLESHKNVGLLHLSWKVFFYFTKTARYGGLFW